ncbi:hypothetical protein L208DRAFT_75659 [Tricholoma matsutake]|nr:hypothetical protein L208DRAFT_75659 [Tricholoma matsutake 945]
MKSFFQRIHDSHSATRRKDPKEASNAKTERSRRVTAGTAPAAHLEQIHTGSRTVDKRGTSQQPEPYHDYRAASSSRPYATLPLFGRNLPSNSRQTPSSTEPLPPQSSSHSILPSQREGHQLRARPSKDIVKAPDYRSVTRDADALKKSSHDRSRSDRLGSAPPPEVRTTQQAYPSKPSERDVYSNLAERNDKYGDKERQKEKMRQENGRGDRDVSERDRGKPMVEEGERPRAREREKDRHRHAHKNREREKEQEQEREARERGLLARARGRERGQESETQEREREREPDRERKSNKERDRDKDRERAMGRNGHDDRDRERQRDQPKAKHGTSDREYPGGQNITNPTYSRPRDQGWIRAKESYVGGERYQEPGKNILQSEHRTTRNPSSKDENKANEGDSSDSSRYRRTVAPSIHRNVPTETRAQMDRKPRHEELPVATSSFAPLSSIPHSNIASTTTENYVANFFASGAMHVHLPAKEPSFQSNQDKLPSQPLETFQEGLLSSNKKEGKRKNHLSNGLASSSKADPPLPSANSTSVVLEHKAKMRENERDNYHSDAKLKESTGMSSWRSFARQKEHFQIPSNAVSDVPLSTLAPSDTISPAQKLRAGQDPSNAYDTSKPTEITQPVTRPYTTRTDTHNPNHEIQYPSTHLTATHSTSDRPQLYSPPPLPEPPSAIVYAGTPGKHVSAVETSSLSKTIPKDVGSGSLRNATSVTNAQTTSVTTGYNASALLQSRNNHVPTYAQPDTSNLVETAQVVPRHNVTSAENHGYHNNATQNSMNVMPSLSNKFHPDFTTQSVPMPPSVVAYPSASSKHESTAELASFLKNIPRDDGSTPLRNTLLASNTQVAVAAMQKVLLPVQNQTNHANAQVKPTNSSNSPYEQSQGQTAKSNIDQNVISKGHQNLPNSLPTPTVVPNLVAEFEARSSAHNGVLRPHVNTGPSIPPASGSSSIAKQS